MQKQPCRWCNKIENKEKGSLGRHKIKMTSGRIGRPWFHQVCLHEMLKAKPTKKNARLVR